MLTMVWAPHDGGCPGAYGERVSQQQIEGNTPGRDAGEIIFSRDARVLNTGWREAQEKARRSLLVSEGY